MHPYHSSNSNIDQELQRLNRQKHEQDEINENTKRKLKRKIFEYEKKIEKLELEKQEVENQLRDLSKLFEEQKSTISDLETKNHNLIQCNKQLECDKQLIETNYAELNKLFDDQKESDKNAKRKLKNKVAEYERKIGKDFLTNTNMASLVTLQHAVTLIGTFESFD